MTVTELINKIKETKAISEKDLSEIDPRTRGGWEASKNRALMDLVTLRTQFREAAVSSSHGVFVTGKEENVTKIMKLAKTLIEDAVIIQTDALYRKIAQDIEPMVSGNRLFDVHMAGRIVENVINIAKELGIASMPDPAVTKKVRSVTLPDLESIVNLVRDVIRETSADDLNRFYIEKSVSDSIEKLNPKEDTVPVFLLNGDDKEVHGELSDKLFKGRNFVLFADKDDAEGQLKLAINKMNLKSKEKKINTKNNKKDQ